MSDFLSGFSDGSGGENSYASQLRPAWMSSCTFKLVKSASELGLIVDGILSSGEKPPLALDTEGEGLDIRVYPADRLDLLDALRAKMRTRSYGDKGNKKKMSYRLPPLTGEDRDWIRHVGRAPVCRVCGISFSPDGKTGYYVPIRHKGDNLPIPAVVDQLRRLVLGTSLRMANSVYDFEVLECDLGLPMTEVAFEDVRIKHYLRDANQKVHGLKHQSESLLKRQMLEFDEVTGDRNMYDMFADEVYEYAGSDAVITYCLADYHDVFCWMRRGSPVRGEDDLGNPWRTDKRDWSAAALPPDYKTRKVEGEWINLLAIQKSVVAVEHALVNPLREMERRTVLLDVPFYRAQKEHAEAARAIAEREVREMLGEPGLNVGSPEAVGEVLFGRLGVPHPGLDSDPKKDKSKTATGQWKTDADTLDLAYEKWGATYPVLKKVVRYRQLDKTLGSYYDKLVVNVDPLSRARLKYQAWNVDTGRLASPGGDPDQEGTTGVNWHGIPAPYDDEAPEEARVLRKGLIAPEGFVIVACDFSGEELRIATNYSQEPLWLKEFLERSGDLHSATARVIYGLPDDGQKAPDDKRQNGKRANFCKLYGGGGPGIARALKCTIEEGHRVSKQMDAGLKGIFAWHRRQEALAEQQGYVTTSGGRVALVPEIFADKRTEARLYGFGCRKSVNAPVQGAGADIMKIALVLLRKALKTRGWYEDDVYPVHNVHDEIIFYVRKTLFREAIDVISETMKLIAVIKAWGWKIGLEMERKAGPSWGDAADWDKVLAGKKKPPKGLEDIAASILAAPPAPKAAEAAESAPKAAEAPTPPKPEPPKAPISLTLRVISPLNRKALEAIVRSCKAAAGETRLVLTSPIGESLIPDGIDVRVDARGILDRLAETAVTIATE